MVVLPFANIGGDPEQEHFVDGVTESLTTDLSRISPPDHAARQLITVPGAASPTSVLAAYWPRALVNSRPERSRRVVSAAPRARGAKRAG
jgi:hypothetical protein